MSITLSALQKQRTDTAANWTAANPTLLSGELGFESDTGKAKLGTGSTAWNSLGYLGVIPSSGIYPLTQLLLPSGTAGAPSLSFSGDSNTGIYSPGADQVAISTNGTGRLFVDSSGRVLVGRSTSVPVIRGVSFEPNLQVLASASILQESGGASLFLGRRLNVTNGAGLAAIYFSGSDGTNVIQSALIAAEVDGVPGTNDMPGRLLFSTTADGSASPTERMRLDSSGRLGLGTSTPNVPLQVIGSSTVTDPVIRATNSGGTQSMALMSGGLRMDGGAPIQIYQGGSEVARIDTSGRLGLGTTSPSALLDVQGSSAAVKVSEPGGAEVRTVAGGSTGFFGTYSNHPLQILINGTNAVRIDTSKRVGIGTTNPQEELHISSASYPYIQVEGTGTTAGSAYYGWNSATGSASIESTGSIRFAVPGLEAARIDSSGRLLLGTSSTAATTRAVFQGNSANASGTGIVQLATGNTSPASGDQLGRLEFGGSTNVGAASIIGDRDGGTWTNGSSQPSRLTFSTTRNVASSPTEAARINNLGAFKATTTGSYAASTSSTHEFINGNTDEEVNVRIRHYAGTSNIYGLQIDFSAQAPNNTTSKFIGCSDSSATRFEVRSNGGIANYQSNDANLCDEREKKNIEALDSTWGCLKNWELKKFHYNEDVDSDDKRYGVIAQQVATHCPEVITDWVKQKGEDAVLDEDGNVVTPAVEEVVRMGVKEQQMMWMAIKALQEAQTRIETLEAEVAALKGA